MSNKQRLHAVSALTTCSIVDEQIFTRLSMSSTIGQGNAYIPHTPRLPHRQPPHPVPEILKGLVSIAIYQNYHHHHHTYRHTLLCTVITEKLTRLHMLGSELNNWYFLVLVFLFSIFSRPIYIYTDSDREWLRWVDRDLTTGYVSNASCLP